MSVIANDYKYVVNLDLTGDALDRLYANRVAVVIPQSESRGESRDYVDEHNNHRWTVVRLVTGHVGLLLEPLPPRPEYVHKPSPARVDIISPYPYCGALPSYAGAERMHGNGGTTIYLSTKL
jgi:hypothetical protein